MSEPTYQAYATARGDWSKVYTNLDWVARWMADHGYTDAEVAYVVGAQPTVPAVVAEVVLAPVETPVEAPVEAPAPLDAVEADRPVWTIPLNVAEPTSASADDAPASSDDTDDTTDTDDITDQESTERLPA